VLLAGLEGEDVRPLALRVGRLADDPPRHAADVVLTGCQKSIVGTAEGLMVARALALADRESAAVAPWRLEHAKRDRVDVRDGECLRLVGRGREVGSRLQAAEEVRLLEDHAGRVAGRLGDVVRVGRAVSVGHFDDLEAEAGRVGLDHLAYLRVERLAEDDFRAAGRVLGHVAGVRGDRRPVVTRCVRDVHPGQLADRGLVLEDRLQHSLADLGLVGRVRGEELPLREDGVDDRRDVVVVDSRAEKRQLLAGRDVPPRQFGQVGDQLLLGERGLEGEPAMEADSFGDVPEELVDRVNTDRGQHCLAIGFREREVPHARLPTARRGTRGTRRRRAGPRPRMGRSGGS
jgi:hypothetical protein